MKLIDKDALVAEIERRRDAALMRQQNLEAIGQETVLNEMVANELNRIISFIDTIEAKEVDLEEEFNNFLDNVEGMPRMWHSDEQIEWAKDIAKHFYYEGYFDGHIHDGDRIVHVDGRKVNVSRFRRVAKPLKEPVSDELEKDAKEYVIKEAAKDISGNWTTDNILNAFKAGAKWKEEQLEKNRLASCDRQTEEEAKIESDFVMGIIENEHRQPTFDDAIKYGMRLKEKEMQSTIELAEDHAMLAGMEKMKEEMMAKAIDVEVKVDAGGYPYIPQIELYDYNKDEPLANEGKKVKVIIIKEH